MNPDSDYGMSTVSCGNGKLRSWLIEQVETGKYAGLVWENDDKSIFRIPWKHAGKQDYNRDEDAALFKAWALFKGKFREGIDKPDPPTWKTRLRCALNKSNDFEELVEKSQLDISDPYKVYRIIPEGAKRHFLLSGSKQEDGGSPQTPPSYPMHPSYPALQTPMSGYMSSAERGWMRDYLPEQTVLPELPYAQCSYPSRSLPWAQGPSMDNGYQITGSFYTYPTDGQPSPFTLDTSMRSAEALSDMRLHVSVFYRDSLWKEVTTSSPEGCRITPCSPDDKLYSPTGGPDLVPLPLDSLPALGRGEECPPSPPGGTLERGVLLWMAPDGLYARRLCQERVFWEGGLSPYGDKPNKLEREHTCKLLHTQDYFAELQGYALHGRPPPRLQVLLSFGDECLDPQRQRRTLTVQVEPMFARQLLYYTQHQQTSGHYYRSYDLSHPGVTEHSMTPALTEDYQRVITHHHSNTLQD
ncbi:interferon regulatory factor 4 isoform X1 [Salmo salar]|uniref:Interferon regulatory factor 4 isoform X1 n=1 Tax=Salmo salar TaxID=8030 RepID=A0A1S3KK48_SALSA|nr:interferon regulatory factor 4 isoform X1 [Salmo salar]|eukprot:XP_013978704.1 PREDICTED: interferon regulatory factor 4-like isoform X1 [Salmo salar]